MKQIARIIIFFLLITTMIVPPNTSYAIGEFTLPPRTVNYDSATSGGTLTFEFQVSPIYYDNVVYWVVTPDTVTLNAAEIQAESSGNTYPGGSIGYTTSLQKATENDISSGRSYKLHYVISNYGSLLPASQGELSFDAMSFVNETPVHNPSGTGDFSIDVSADTQGTIYAALYLLGSSPTKDDIIDSQGTALAYDYKIITTPEEKVTLDFTYSGLMLNHEYSVYIVRMDSNGNYYFSDSPSDSPLQLPKVEFTNAVYSNDTLSDLTDDYISIIFDEVLTNPGNIDDYFIQVGTGQGEQFEPYNFSFIPGIDYTFKSYDPTTYTVHLGVTPTGLEKLKSLSLNSSSVMQIRANAVSTIRPRVPDNVWVDISPFDLTVINRQNKSKLITAVYDEFETLDVNDDGILLGFDSSDVTEIGSTTDYEVAIDTHSSNGFVSADSVLTASDYTVTPQNGGVRLNFTATGLTKLPTSGLSFWRVTIVNPNNLTPNVDPDCKVVTFSRNIMPSPPPNSGNGSSSGNSSNKDDKDDRKPIKAPVVEITTPQVEEEFSQQISDQNGTNSPVFTDTENHWAKSDIDFVIQRGLFSGTGDGKFSPNMPMTRGMFVTVLGKLAKVDLTRFTSSSFKDVNSDAYYLPYIQWANTSGIVNGVSSEEFAPDMEISREQMAVMLLNYIKAMNIYLATLNEEKQFADTDEMSIWAKEAVKAIQMSGIISGKPDNKFDPKGIATRAEVSSMLRRFIELIEGRN